MAFEARRINASDFPGEVTMYMATDQHPVYPGIGDAARDFMRDLMDEAALTGNPDAEGYWLVIRVEPDGAGSITQIPPHSANA